MSGKRCLVTGATSGIGRETTRGLAEQGADVVLVSRDPERCRGLAEELQARAGGRITHHAADLADPESIRALCATVNATYDRLDVLVNNAGAVFLKRELSRDGFERTWALNHLGYFRVTCGLMPLLRAAPSARIVNVSSDAHRSMREGLDWDDLQYERTKFKPFRAYCQSKLANVLFTRELARRSSGRPITANSLHPGFVATNFFAFPGMTGTLVRLIAKLFAISPERGARTPIYLATSPDVAGQTAAYFNKCKAVDPAPAAKDDAAARRLWETTAAMTGTDLES
jgi:NAD(P)-dependent dehydrogenase (short-subunit alcohol dehydrogenase family)